MLPRSALTTLAGPAALLLAGQAAARPGGPRGAPASPPPVWAEAQRDAVYLGQVQDFRAHRAAAFWMLQAGKVLYLDLAVERAGAGREFVPAPRVGTLPADVRPGLPGKVRFFRIQEAGADPRDEPGGGTFLAFAKAPPGGGPAKALDPEAAALLAAAGPSPDATRALRERLGRATPGEHDAALRALLLARARETLRDVLAGARSSGENPETGWQAQAFARGLGALPRLDRPPRGTLSLLAAAAAEWVRSPAPDAAARALASLVGTEFSGRELGPREPHGPGIEYRVEPRLGPFEREIEWWDLLSEIEPRFAQQVLSRLRHVVGETGVWIEDADPRTGSIVGFREAPWILEAGVRVPAGLAFGSQVSVVSKPPPSGKDGACRRVLALRLDARDPDALANQVLKEGDGRMIGLMARQRAEGRGALPPDWGKRIGTLAAFSHLEAVHQSRDRIFLDEIESLLPRTLKEAHIRSDTESIRQPIVVALGWIAAGAHDRARRLLGEAPALIRAHGVPYTSDGKLSPYQESLIAAAAWLADRLEHPDVQRKEFPAHPGSEFVPWVEAVDPTLLRRAGLEAGK